MLSPRTLGLSAVCLSLLLMAACGDDEGEESSGTMSSSRDGDAGKAGLDLTGLWVSTDFECRSSKKRETLQVDHRGVNVTGTKVIGDDCVPAGFVSFEGKLPRAEIAVSELPVSFAVKLYGGDPGAPETIGVSDSGMAKVTSPDSISLQLSRSTIVLTRNTESPAAGGGGSGGFAPAAGRSGAGGRPGGTGGTAGTGGRPGSTAGAGGSPDEPPEEGGAGAGGGGSGGVPGGRASARGNTSAAGSGGRPAAGSGGRGGAGAGARAAGAGGMSEDAGSGGRGGAGAGAGGSEEAGSGGAAADCRGPLLPGATCDHVQQCGCKTDETCQFAGAEPPRCQPAGPKADGELCEAIPECGAGLLCVDGICRRNCRVDDDCSGTCTDATYDGMAVEGLKFCLDPCDPVLAPSCTSPRSDCAPCALGSTCLPSDEGFAYCDATELVLNRAPGERCTRDAECFGGGCQAEQCRRWCRADSDCAAEETCKFGTGRYIRQGVEAGFCIPE